MVIARSAELTFSARPSTPMHEQASITLSAKGDLFGELDYMCASHARAEAGGSGPCKEGLATVAYGRYLLS